MAAYQWATQFGFHGKVRRISIDAVQVLAVFSEDDTVFERLAALTAVANSLPEYRTLKADYSTSYTKYLFTSFKIHKTLHHHINSAHGASDEPEVDCVSDISSVSGGSSFVGGW